ncbi:hypothetical protein [Bacillus piscicola]|nr:hypothetical protein [Bacillus piscicola]
MEAQNGHHLGVPEPTCTLPNKLWRPLPLSCYKWFGDCRKAASSIN